MITSSFTRLNPLAQHERQVLDLFGGMGPDLESFRCTYGSMLAENVVWETVGRPPRVGQQACLDYLETLNRDTGMEYCDVEVLAIASDGRTVFTERIDIMRRGDGSAFKDFRIVGVVEFDDADLISRYTDYCDLSALVG